MFRKILNGKINVFFSKRNIFKGFRSNYLHKEFSNYCAQSVCGGGRLVGINISVQEISIQRRVYKMGEKMVLVLG